MITAGTTTPLSLATNPKPAATTQAQRPSRSNGSRRSARASPAVPAQPACPRQHDREPGRHGHHQKGRGVAGQQRKVGVPLAAQRLIRAPAEQIAGEPAEVRSRPWRASEVDRGEQRERADRHTRGNERRPPCRTPARRRQSQQSECRHQGDHATDVRAEPGRAVGQDGDRADGGDGGHRPGQPHCQQRRGEQRRDGKHPEGRVADTGKPPGHQRVVAQPSRPAADAHP